MAVFSRAHYEDLEKWRRQLGNQLVLFDDTERNDMSRSIRERSYVVHVFDKLCKSVTAGCKIRH